MVSAQLSVQLFCQTGLVPVTPNVIGKLTPLTRGRKMLRGEPVAVNAPVAALTENADSVGVTAESIAYTYWPCGSATTAIGPTQLPPEQAVSTVLAGASEPLVALI